MTTEPTKARKPRTSTTANKTTANTRTSAKSVEMFHCVDVGNYSVKAISQGQAHPLSIRSLLVDPTHYRKQKHSPDSPLLLLEGKQYHFGHAAREYGIPVKPLVLGDKNEPELFKAAVLSTLQPGEDGEALTVRLRVTVPNTYREETEQSIIETLTGKHTYTVNGLNATATVLSVDVLTEGIPAYHYAKGLGLVPDRGYTLLIDIGGGTFNVLVFSPDGRVVGQPQSTHHGGGIALAQRIANIHSIQAKLNSVPDLSIIQDGITDGSNAYGMLDVGWGDMMPAITEEWFKEGVNAMLVMCGQYLPQVKRILFTGGNANLLRPWIEKGALNEVIPNPTVANVLGLLSV